MARTGRPRKNPALKVVSGGGRSEKARPENPDQKKGRLYLSPETPERPAHLDAMEGKIWDQLVTQLSHIGALRKVDEGTLASYCTAYATIMRAKEALAEHRKKNGSDFFSTDGRHGEMIRVHPAHGIIERNIKIIKTLAVEFGMTPAGRKGLGFNPAQPLLPGLDEEGPLQKDPTAGLFN